MFEQMDIDLPNKLSAQLNEDIEFWLPYIVIDDIVVEPDFDRNFVSISLSFRVTEDGANQQIIMFIDSAGTTTLG